MRKVLSVLGYLLTAIVFCSSLSIAQEYPVLVDGKVAPETGFGIGIDDSERLRNWLAPAADSLEIKYPGKLGWAALFITVGGPAVNPPRPYQDFSEYKRLTVEMRGESGGECVKVGIKDYNDPDDGTEPKKAAKLTKNWKTYEFEMSYFLNRPSNRSSLDMKKLYVVTELLFPCDPHKNHNQTVYLRNIKFIK